MFLQNQACSNHVSQLLIQAQKIMKNLKGKPS